MSLMSLVSFAPQKTKQNVMMLIVEDFAEKIAFYSLHNFTNIILLVNAS